MSSVFDLDSYLRRIGYAGPRRPTLATLRVVVALQTSAIAFENLDPLLGRAVHLDVRSLQRKLVDSRRGGYCFELDLLLGHALRAMGFSVRDLAARVRWNMPVEVATPRTHMLLAVEVDGAVYIADAGFGVHTPTAPLRLDTDEEQATPHEPFRVRATRSGRTTSYLVQAQIRDRWLDVYDFDMQPQLLADYELLSWYLSHHPASRFVTNLIAARSVPGRRYTLQDNVLATHVTGAASTREVLATPAELRDALESVFGIAVPVGAEVDAVLARACGPVARADLAGADGARRADTLIAARAGRGPSRPRSSRPRHGRGRSSRP